MLKRSSSILVSLLLTLPVSGQDWQGYPGISPDTDGGVRNATEKLSKAEEARKQRILRLREALNTIEAAQDMRTLSKNLEMLRRGFPESREVLLEGTRRYSSRARTISITLLGELDPYSHLRQFSLALEDGAPSVRMAALRGLRKLGKRGSDPVDEYILKETVPNVRILAIKTLQDCGEPGVVFTLTDLLKRETRTTVRREAVKALQVLSGANYGDDTDAWVSHVELLKNGRFFEGIIPYLEDLQDLRDLEEEFDELEDWEGLPATPTDEG